MPAETIDGMSVWTVREAAARAVAHARAGDGPVFVEALTYRFVGHSRSDPGAYRPEGELDRVEGSAIRSSSSARSSRRRESMRPTLDEVERT